jgi:hypothetical protein
MTSSISPAFPFCMIKKALLKVFCNTCIETFVLTKKDVNVPHSYLIYLRCFDRYNTIPASDIIVIRLLAKPDAVRYLVAGSGVEPNLEDYAYVSPIS